MNKCIILFLVLFMTLTNTLFQDSVKLGLLCFLDKGKKAKVVYYEFNNAPKKAGLSKNMTKIYQIFVKLLFTDIDAPSG